MTKYSPAPTFIVFDDPPAGQLPKPAGFPAATIASGRVQALDGVTL
jgi:hypothetical protein